MSASNPPRRFAPLSAAATGKSEVDGRMVLKGIVFDMDGTLSSETLPLPSHHLFLDPPSSNLEINGSAQLSSLSLASKGEPQNYMFGEMRSALGITKSEDILDHIYALPESEQDEAHAKIQAIERRAMENQVPQAGLVSLMEHLDARDVKKPSVRGISTISPDGATNRLALSTPVTHLLSTHLPGHISAFSPIITRDFRPPKPSPAGILHIAQAWGLISSSEISNEGRPIAKRAIPLIMVGDSVDDMEAGREAGAATVLLRSEGKEELERDERTDLVISRLDELIDILENGFEGRQG
ncbi:hypothetical protein H2203_004885 [Taxawa tesnikishii (nom. ined.)]|nr:hypothetical protein H2203_004885 [Dothideales sp. JES 119]